MAEARTAKTKTSRVKWSDAEREAIREAARDKRKANARLNPAEARAEGEREVQAKIAELPEPDRMMARRIHELVAKAAPSLVPRTFYGMPAYSMDGKTLCFFKPASKFKERYSTFGFEQVANLDDGSMWATSWALTDLTAEDEKRLAALVRRAVES